MPLTDKLPEWIRNAGVKTDGAFIQGAIYLTLMTAVDAVIIYFGLIPLPQMGFRLDTLPMGIVAGLLCQLPIILLMFTADWRDSEAAKRRAQKDAVHARMHMKVSFFDAPIAEIFWSGIILSSIAAYLTSIGLQPLPSGILAILLSTGIHLCSHLGYLMPTVPDEWFAFMLTMGLSRTAFVLSNNIIAPILGHFLLNPLCFAIWRWRGLLY